MGEISGFGGGYEKRCQDMLDAGVRWLEGRGNADLKGHGYQNVFGIFEADSNDAKQLEEVILAAAGGDATGAMHQTVMQRLFFISKNGWDKYCAELREHEAKEQLPPASTS